MLLEVTRVTTDEEHAMALERINQLWDAKEGESLDELRIIAMLVEEYEERRWPLQNLRDPIEIIRGAMDHAGHSRADLVRLLGSASRASEILNKKRALTLDMIRAISGAWGIPRSLLTEAYELVA